ncbi:TlpA family protein disulfide reductase [Mucilaginibacter terrae]|uniref:Peroxiredoxin n=1 Tax=Mucilaginibacter terrae TaxID=1955052 RepID=A0ABU3GZS7_9SPHI|nr:TlpA disulfide reductase family protein [Mucilaginibacter terrae]MDT3404150.1 peroxiredoxin [Mucilaginibacter terrae]
MKKFIHCFFVLLWCFCVNQTKAQAPVTAPAKVYKMPKLDERSFVRDSSGKRYEYTAWSSMVASGRYAVKVATLPNEKPSLIIGRLNKEERKEAMGKLPQPAESTFFKTGEAFKPFNVPDITGQPVDMKQLAGKTVVMSFWFINNNNCRRQIPDLNDLVETYKGDPNVIFISVAMDDKEALNEFLQLTPFKYRHLERGKSIASKYNVNQFPTDVVIDKTGKVKFHTSGYSPATYYWIAKTIDEVKAS